ncbi:hypothetical protein BOX15_Mlig018452g2 [Macrostomum lignano]|uniref:Mitochondria-eating protein n=2 Tax=Macrostomum lignano TaxID=282301 RepID=A0A267FVA6_9PLAT|nr:hypothetical protein BOX15_Mlig018452g2 [Macrostomum lignano]
MGNNHSSKSKHKVQISSALVEASSGHRGGSGSDQRRSLPVAEADSMQYRQQVGTQQQQQQSPKVQPRQHPPHSAGAAGVRHSIATATVGNSTMSADVQLVLSQLIEKKPKYSLLKQLDFSELDERARFVVFEAACDLLDQAKTIDSLREERQMMRSNFNVVRRVASIDHLDNPRHHRVASQELASCIQQELQRRPPRLTSPTTAATAEADPASPASSSSGMLGDLIRSYLQLERQFVEQIRQELLSRRGLFADGVQACRAVHRLLANMLEAAEVLHRRRVEELVQTVTSPTEASGTQVLRARLTLPTEEGKAIRDSVKRLLSQSSSLCQMPWDSLVDPSQHPQFRQLPSSSAAFLNACSAWCWRAVCSSLARVTIVPAEEGAPFRQELHRCELGLGVGRPVACCLWPMLRQGRTVICKALVQTAPVLGPIRD